MIGGDRIAAVLEMYHSRIEAERRAPRTEPPGGRDGGHDQRMRAIGPETGQLAVTMTAELSVAFDFVFLDLWKDLYVPCLEAFYPRLAPGAIVVADNMLRSGTDDLKAYGRAVRAKPGISSVLLPVGSGLEVSRYDPI
jgi:predicted O-methyltransferase YrrM